jgi:hypothetical protein
MRAMHLTRVVALGAGVAALSVAVACGTSSHPPAYDPGPVPTEGGAADAGQTPAFGDASPDDPYYDCAPVDAGGGSCPCKPDPTLHGVYTVACGFGVCSDVPGASSYCTPDGHFIRLSICDPDAGFRIPACAPGTHPLPPR